MPETKKRRKPAQTQELLRQVLDGQKRLEERMSALEAQQTMQNAAWQRQGRVIDEINRRCMEKLGLKCPLLEDDDSDSSDGETNGSGATT